MLRWRAAVSLCHFILQARAISNQDSDGRVAVAIGPRQLVLTNGSQVGTLTEPSEDRDQRAALLQVRANAVKEDTKSAQLDKAVQGKANKGEEPEFIRLSASERFHGLFSEDGEFKGSSRGIRRAAARSPHSSRMSLQLNTLILAAWMHFVDCINAGKTTEGNTGPVDEWCFGDAVIYYRLPPELSDEDKKKKKTELDTEKNKEETARIAGQTDFFGNPLEPGEKSWHGSNDNDRKLEGIEGKFRDLYAEAADQIYVDGVRRRKESIKPAMTRSFLSKFKSMNLKRTFPFGFGKHINNCWEVAKAARASDANVADKTVSMHEFAYAFLLAFGYSGYMNFDWCSSPIVQGADWLQLVRWSTAEITTAEDKKLFRNTFDRDEHSYHTSENWTELHPGEVLRPGGEIPKYDAKCTKREIQPDSSSRFQGRHIGGQSGESGYEREHDLMDKWREAISKDREVVSWNNAGEGNGQRFDNSAHHWYSGHERGQNPDKRMSEFPPVSQNSFLRFFMNQNIDMFDNLLDSNYENDVEDPYDYDDEELEEGDAAVSDEAATERMQAEKEASKARLQRKSADQKKELQSYMKFLQKVYTAADSMVSFSTQGYDDTSISRRRTRKWLSDPSFQYAALVAHEYCFEHIRRDKMDTDHGRDVMMVAPPSMPWHLLAEFQKKKLPEWCSKMGDADSFAEEDDAAKISHLDIGAAQCQDIQCCNEKCRLTIPAHLLEDMPQPKVEYTPSPQEVLDKMQHDHDKAEEDKAEEIRLSKVKADEEEAARLEAEKNPPEEEVEEEEEKEEPAYVPKPIRLQFIGE